MLKISESQLFHADRRQTVRGTKGQTDMTKLKVAVRNFAKAPEKKEKQ